MLGGELYRENHGSAFKLRGSIDRLILGSFSIATPFRANLTFERPWIPVFTKLASK